MTKKSMCCLIYREKMAGVNLHEGNIEGASELWLERVYLK